MAWTNVEHHVFSDRWRVTSLVQAFQELMLGFIVLLCAIISIITTKLLRSSGLCLSCHSCEVDRGRGAGAQLELCQNSRGKHQRLTGNSNIGRHLGKDANMSFICEKCALHRPDCSCSSANGSSTPAPVRAKASFKCSPPSPVHVNCSSSLEHHSCSRHWQEGDASCDRVDSFTSEIVGDPSPDELSVRAASIVAGKTSGLHSSECRLCNLAMSSEPSLSGRPLKRKFAKVFPDHTRDGSPRDPTQEFGDTESGIAKRTPVCGIHHNHGDRDDAGASLNLYQEEMVVDDECEDGDQLSAMPKQFVVSDTEDAENLRKASWEESSGNSSQDSFTFIRRFPVDYGRTVEASGNRNEEGVSGDSQFGRGARGDITPEWSGSYDVSHSFDEMEGGSSVANQEDDDERLEYCGVKELREALRAERKALAGLYNELEQERSASATAANEAMAMITRLQEEKAAAQMECRQFQRMAEEKQLYDQEAIVLLQDILVRRDKEMFHLEEEARLYRQRLLALTMNELEGAVDPSEGPKKKSDFLLIERETLLLEGNDEWKNKRDRREERLLAEIKEWVTAANEKVAAKSPARIPAIKEDEESGEKGRLSWKISNMSIDSGRKNLLESFSSVGGEEENQRDGAVTEAGAGSEVGTEETAARNEDAGAAAGYESFHHMMDSLRKEPGLRDEASLETLNKIEEKFQKQSRTGQVRNEDDLRRIWRNTLRSFGPAAGENAATRALNKQDPKGQTQKTTDNSGLMSGIVRDAEANRAMEEKRISVLEYVWKFEEQLHRGGAKKPALQLGRASSSDINKSEKSCSFISELALEDQSPRAALMEFSATESEREKPKRSADGRLPPVVSRFRRHASEGDRFYVRGEVAPSSKIAVESQERRIERPFRHEDDESSEGSLVHDVYEVQRDSLETSTPKRSDSIFNGEVRKSVSSTSNRLMSGESACYPDSDVYMEFLGDRLGKPDPLPGYHSAEHRASATGRSYSQTGAGRCVMSSAEDESLEHDFEWPVTSTSGRFRDRAQAAGQRTPQTPSPIGMTGDVVDQLTGRLRTLEADRETMQRTISSLRAENGEMQLLREIAQQLRELRGIDQKGINNAEPHGPTLASSIKGMLSFSRLRCSVQAQLNKLARVFLRNVELGVCRGDQHVGLCRLLQISPLRPSRVTRGAEATAEEIVLNGSQEGSFQPAATRSLLSQHSWPMDARERSGTALSGWDY